MKTGLRKRILRILLERPGLTRSELSELINKRKNTVGEACGKLLSEKKLVSRTPGKHRNVGLFLNPAAFYSLGVEHTVDELRLVLMDAGLNVSEKRRVNLARSSGEKRADLIVSSVVEYLRSLKIPGEKISGIGYGDFIPHNIGTGLKARSIWMPDWGQIDIKAVFEGSLNFETTVMRCTDACAVAEHVWGACKGVASFIMVQLGEGIGLSVFYNGKCLKGTTDIFGELGHTVYDRSGDICKCGNRGCLETFAGKNAIIKKVKDNLVSNTGFMKKNRNLGVTFEDIIFNTGQGNKLSLLVLSDAASAIGDSIANVINILGITTVVLYGDTAKAGEVLTGAVCDCIKQHCVYPLNTHSRVFASSLDVFSSAAGAAYMVMAEGFAS